jgi:hypothetical protein
MRFMVMFPFLRAFRLVLNQTWEIECGEGQEFLADPNVLFWQPFSLATTAKMSEIATLRSHLLAPSSANGDPVKLVAFREKCRMME